MKNNYKIGRNGEAIAQRYLEKNGYKIITTNYYTRKGEIDIIATQGKEIIFIEVKTRSSIEFGRPIEAITKNKQKHMYQTAKCPLHFKLNAGGISCLSFLFILRSMHP